MVPVLTGTAPGQQVKVYAIGVNRDGVPDQVNAELAGSGAFATLPQPAAVASTGSLLAAAAATGPAGRVEYQAESATRSGAVVASNRPGYTGPGFVDYLHPSDDYVQWTVHAPKAGAYVLQWRYANGDTDRPLALTVNGATQSRKVSMPPISGWSSWRLSSMTAQLKAGANTVRLTAAGRSGANVDKLVLMPAPAASTRVSVLQAEAARLSGAVRANKYPGARGSGYADYQRPTGDSVQWTVPAPAAGQYTLAWRYANGDGIDRPLVLLLDGKRALRWVSMPPTGSFGTWKAATASVALPAGTHTLSLVAAGASGPNIDQMTVIRS